MHFLQPGYLWLLLLAIIPIALYLFRRKSRQVSVSTLVFFKTLAMEHQESAWLRKLKKLISFVLTMTVILAAIMALSRLITGQGRDGHYRTYVVLLDRSASMGVSDENGDSRIDLAKRILRERFLSVPEEAGVALVAYDERPAIVQPRTLIRREFLSRLDEVRVRPIAGDKSSAIESALLLANLEKPALILHVSDFGGFGGKEYIELPDAIDRELIDVSVPAPVNAGITSFQIRNTPIERDSFDVHARVQLNSSAETSQEINLELFVGGIPSQVRAFDLEPGESETFEFRVRGGGGQILRMQISTENDSFPLDDTVISPLPEPRPVVAVWIRENSETKSQDAYTGLALRAIQESGTLELLAGTPDQWPLQHEVDAVIFDGWLPEEWPDDLPAVVINPDRSAGPVIARRLSQAIPYDAIRVTNEDHPVLFRVSSSRVALSQTSVFEASGSFEPLWMAGREPVLAAGEVEGNRLVVMAFSPQLSERLPLTASFPLLLGNSLLWVTEESDEVRKRLMNSPTGSFADVAGDSVTWTDWQEDRLRKRVFPLEGSTLEMSRPGIWQTEDGRMGTSHLLSSRESDIPRLDPEVAEAAAGESPRGGIGIIRFLLILIVLVLIIESWLFHRLAVY